MVLDEEWHHPYSREQAAFPAAWVRQAKFWPAVSRVDNVYGEPPNPCPKTVNDAVCYACAWQSADLHSPDFL